MWQTQSSAQSHLCHGCEDAGGAKGATHHNFLWVPSLSGNVFKMSCCPIGDLHDKLNLECLNKEQLNNNTRRSLQWFQGIFLGMFLCLVLTGASLSILTMSSKEVIKELREELNMLDSSMQVMALHGTVLDYHKINLNKN